MFYAGGAAEAAIGKAAPWFVLAVMLFSFAVRSVYMESCSMYVRGGVYVVVHDSMGPVMAKLSVSALVFDYILTGPISVVSAGQYLGALLNEISQLLKSHYRIDVDMFAAGVGILITLYFWWENVKGVHESSGKALRIMQITTVMVGILLIWCPITLLLKDRWTLPPAPVPANLNFSDAAQGWFKGTSLLQLSMVAIIVAFGHSLLSMSGFETLAQVYREIASPKMKNLKITANITCWYAVFCTGIISLFAVMIIPDDIRPSYINNLIGGLAMNLSGPYVLRLGFHIFVVIVGGLILAGAANTSLIGANGVLNRVAEDGVLLPWFRKPQKRYGTTYRMVGIIAILQILTIVGSRGDMTILAEAYAFGVVWSFFMKALGVMVLRFQRHDQEYKTPLNLRVGGKEIPIGLGLTTLTLGFVAVANLFTKQIATKYGVAFTAILFVVFTVSEQVNLRRSQTERKGLEQFNLDHRPQVDAVSIHARPGCVLVAVRDNRRMEHLKRVLEKTNLRRYDIVVMTVRQVTAGAGEYDLGENQLWGDYEKELFSNVVGLAEREGKPVELLVVPALNPFDAMADTATRLRASRLVTGVSARMTSEELSRQIGLAWERLPEPRHPFSLEIISADRASTFVNLGPHPPRLWPEDIDLLHEIWLELSDGENLGAQLHHRDIVGLALRNLRKDLNASNRRAMVDAIRNELRTDIVSGPAGTTPEAPENDQPEG